MLGGESKNAETAEPSEMSVDSEKIKGSDVHFMSDFDELALSWINEEEGKFQSKKSLTGFSDVSDIYEGKEIKSKRLRANYQGGNSMPDDQGHALESTTVPSSAIASTNIPLISQTKKKRIKIPYNQRIKS